MTVVATLPAVKNLGPSLRGLRRFQVYEKLVTGETVPALSQSAWTPKINCFGARAIYIALFATNNVTGESVDVGYYHYESQTIRNEAQGDSGIIETGPGGAWTVGALHRVNPVVASNYSNEIIAARFFDFRIRNDDGVVALNGVEATAIVAWW